MPPRVKVQKLITSAIEEHAQRALIAELPHEGARRLRAVSMPGASSWMHAVPAEERFRMTDMEVRLAIRFWLGLNPVEAMPTSCECDVPMTPTYSHACPRLRGRTVRFRHDALVQTVARFARDMGAAVTVEDYDMQHDHGVRPDLTISIGARNALVDVSVTHSLSPSLLNVNNPAVRRERAKTARYEEMAILEDCAFFPFVADSFGFIPPRSQDLLRKFLFPADERSNASPVSIEAMFRMISVALQRGNARIALQGVFRTRQASRAAALISGTRFAGR